MLLLQICGCRYWHTRPTSYFRSHLYHYMLDPSRYNFLPANEHDDLVVRQARASFGVHGNKGKFNT